MINLFKKQDASLDLRPIIEDVSLDSKTIKDVNDIVTLKPEG